MDFRLAAILVILKSTLKEINQYSINVKVIIGFCQQTPIAKQESYWEKVLADIFLLGPIFLLLRSFSVLNVPNVGHRKISYSGHQLFFLSLISSFPSLEPIHVSFNFWFIYPMRKSDFKYHQIFSIYDRRVDKLSQRRGKIILHF